MMVTIIAAVASNGAIGRGNALLWHISADMKFFKETTLTHPVIMGRRTFESLGRPLPGRLNIVVSRTLSSPPENVSVASSLRDALCLAGGADCFVIGGAQIYARAMQLADRLLITRVRCCPEDADAFFPAVEPAQWRLASRSETLRDEKSGLEFCFEEYVKI